MATEIKIVLALTLALVVTGFLIPALHRLAHRIRLVDQPNHRKRHFRVTPLTGGIATFCGFLIGATVIGIDWQSYWTLLVGMVILLITGLLDDYVDISAALRLMLQVAVAALMVFYGGLEIQSLGLLFGEAHGPVLLGPWSAPFTIACVVFIVNAINMADGLDGLAGCSALVIFILLALTGWLDGAPFGLVAISMILAFSTMGFLIHNMRNPFRRRASAFLGDSGSMAIGFAIAWLAVALGTREGGAVDPISIAWILIIPSMDTLALFFRRLRLGRSPLSPDRAHLHHILLRCGYNVHQVVHSIHFMVLATGLFGILGWVFHRPEWLSFTLAATVLIGYQYFLANAGRVVRWHRKRNTKSLSPAQPPNCAIAADQDSG